MNIRFRSAAAAFVAIAMTAGAGISSGVAAGPVRVIAQASPTTGATPVETMAPMRTMVPMPTQAPGVPTPDANGVTPVKQGGTTENSNGANWLDKFNRNPGPDTSQMDAPLDVPIRNGVMKTTKKMPKVKVKKMKTKPPA